MNVGELLRERDRLLGVIEEAKRAKARIKQLNVLIAMYGDDDKVPADKRPVSELPQCLYRDCTKPQFIRGVCSMHYSRWNRAKTSVLGKDIYSFMTEAKTGKSHPGPKAPKGSKTLKAVS